MAIHPLIRTVLIFVILWAVLFAASYDSAVKNDEELAKRRKELEEDRIRLFDMTVRNDAAESTVYRAEQKENGEAHFVMSGVSGGQEIVHPVEEFDLDALNALCTRLNLFRYHGTILIGEGNKEADRLRIIFESGREICAKSSIEYPLFHPDDVTEVQTFFQTRLS
ncbi:MAG: hypothetical protein LUE86_14180 [Clostridiales bacterium]|nr:hypothetical protein [Clostridiales bacterium]